MADQLTDEQIEELRGSFNLYDRDGNGTISISELGAVMKSLGQCPTKAELLDIVKDADINGDGGIDFPEFLKMSARKMDTTDSEGETLAAFRVFDLDDGGYITSNKLKRVMKSLGLEATDEDIEEMILEADLDGDGKISYNEFSTMLNKK